MVSTHSNRHGTKTYHPSYVLISTSTGHEHAAHLSSPLHRHQVALTTHHHIPPIPLQQLYHLSLSALHLQCPTLGLKSATPPFARCDKPRPPRALVPLDPETHIDPPVQLIQFSADPRHFGSKVYLVAQQLSRGGVRAECVEDGADCRGIEFLVVEDSQRGEED